MRELIKNMIKRLFPKWWNKGLPTADDVCGILADKEDGDLYREDDLSHS